MVDANVFEALDSGDESDLDRFLLPHVRNLKTEYQRLGNPQLLYMAAHGLAAALQHLRSSGRSYQFARLHSFLGEMLIAQGRDAAALGIAAEHLGLALEVVRHVSGVSEEVLRAQIQIELLISIVYKAVGDRDASFRSIERAKREIGPGMGGSPVDMIPLTRQQIIMDQTATGHRLLLEGALRYQDDRPKESYRSIKRAFEFALNSGSARDADTIVRELKSSFDLIADTSPPISHVSFQKNIGQYLILSGRAEDAVALLSRTRAAALNAKLDGQIRQIDRLLSEARGGAHAPVLETFAVAADSD